MEKHEYFYLPFLRFIIFFLFKLFLIIRLIKLHKHWNNQQQNTQSLTLVKDYTENTHTYMKTHTQQD